VAAVIAGLVLWTLSGFMVLCLAMSLCVGIFIEFIAYLDSIDTRGQRRDALHLWHVAHYCGAHDAVFVYGHPTTYRPEAFAAIMHPDAPPPVAAPAPANA
jgi:hypothetical protein